jgi:hypothetical protein
MQLNFVFTVFSVNLADNILTNHNILLPWKMISQLKNVPFF